MPAFLAIMKLCVAPASADVLDAIDTIRATDNGVRAKLRPPNQGCSKVEISGSSGWAESARDLRWRANSAGVIHFSAQRGRASL